MLLVAPVTIATSTTADIFTTSIGPVSVTAELTGLDEPWAIAFFPDSGGLITERDGRLLLFNDDGQLTNVTGAPGVWASGQGGLLDVVVARDFAETGEIFLSYAKPVDGGAATAVAVATFRKDPARLENLRDIFVMNRPTGRGQHFGSRIVEAPDGTLWVTLGDRGDRGQAQNPMTHNGAIVRIARDGSIPADNPFAESGALPEIWSYGHRNPQGAALSPAGELWTVEHGAQGGDEINKPGKGLNYGWPTITYGWDYNGSTIGIGTEADGLEQPVFYWDPSIAPSGMMIYSGKMFPDWAGDIFVGSLKFSYISRLEQTGEGMREAEQLFRDDFIRIRDIREAPDGSIWFLSVGDGVAYQLSSVD